MEVTIDKINESLEELLYCDYPLFIEDLDFERHFNDMVLRNNKFDVDNDRFIKDIYKTKKNLSTDKMVEIVVNFFRKVRPDYLEDLEYVLNEVVEIAPQTEEDDKSYLTFEDDIDIIHIVQRGNIEDVFSLTHEFMHYTNNSREKSNQTTSYFTEALSSYIELLLCDYITEYYPEYAKDALKMRREAFVSLYETCVKNKIFFDLVDKKSDGKKITSYDLTQIYARTASYVKSDNLTEMAFDEILEELCDDPESTLIISARYSFALPLATYMYENMSKEEVFSLNDSLNELSHEDVVNYFNFDLKEDPVYEFSLEDEDYIKV